MSTFPFLFLFGCVRESVPSMSYLHRNLIVIIIIIIIIITIIIRV